MVRGEGVFTRELEEDMRYIARVFVHKSFSSVHELSCAALSESALSYSTDWTEALWEKFIKRFLLLIEWTLASGTSFYCGPVALFPLWTTTGGHLYLVCGFIPILVSA